MHRKTHAFFQSDLFQSFDPTTIKFKKDCGTSREIKAIYKYESKSILASKIFLALIKMILKDMVKTGCTFHLPTKAISMFTWTKLQDETFKRAYISGKFKDLDFLQANFTIYLPIMKYYYRNTFVEKAIILPENLKQEIIENTNNGFKYC